MARSINIDRPRNVSPDPQVRVRTVYCANTAASHSLLCIYRHLQAVLLSVGMASRHQAILVILVCLVTVACGVPFRTLGGERSLLDFNATGTALNCGQRGYSEVRL